MCVVSFNILKEILWYRLLTLNLNRSVVFVPAIRREGKAIRRAA